ncbi:MAG: hypothetical protein ACFE95_22460 [Candidatus Hodarchaeota archaeon]
MCSDSIKDLIHRSNLRNKDKIPENWKDQLISVYFIRGRDCICLFSHNFQFRYVPNKDNQLVGWGFSAFHKMIKEIVDGSANLRLVDVVEKKILAGRSSNILVVLITTTNTPFYRRKLKEIAEIFKKLYLLQLQINSETLVRQEDYALIGNLIRLVFNDHPYSMIRIVPMIFKSIQQPSIKMSKKVKREPKILNKASFSLKRKKNRI